MEILFIRHQQPLHSKKKKTIETSTPGDHDFGWETSEDTVSWMPGTSSGVLRCNLATAQ